MSGIERCLTPEEVILNSAAASVRVAIDFVVDLDDLKRRLHGSRWELVGNHQGIELQIIDGEPKMQVFVGFPSGVTVRRWKSGADWDTSISVYPDYLASSPIFDDLRQIGNSEMSYSEVARVFSEVAEILL